MYHPRLSPKRIEPLLIIWKKNSIKIHSLQLLINNINNNNNNNNNYNNSYSNNNNNSNNNYNNLCWVNLI